MTIFTPRPLTSGKSNLGFTLIEVLAALLIFSVSITGLIRAGSESARTVFALEQKMLAGIIADNQLVLARAKPVRLGIRTGQSQLKGQNFDWEVQTLATDVPEFFQIVVKIFPEDSSFKTRASTAPLLMERTAFRVRSSGG